MPEKPHNGKNACVPREERVGWLPADFSGHPHQCHYCPYLQEGTGLGWEDLAGSLVEKAEKKGPKS